MIDGWGIFCDVVYMWFLLDLTDYKSPLLRVMAWCRQATGHYLKQCWPRSVSPYGITRPQCGKLILNVEPQCVSSKQHDDVIKWKHFSRYWPFVWGIQRSLVNSSHKGQWRGGLGFSLICAWINDWVNNCEAGDLRCYRIHYDVVILLNIETADIIGL